MDSLVAKLHVTRVRRWCFNPLLRTTEEAHAFMREPLGREHRMALALDGTAIVGNGPATVPPSVAVDISEAALGEAADQIAAHPTH